MELVSFDVSCNGNRIQQIKSAALKELKNVVVLETHISDVITSKPNAGHDCFTWNAQKLQQKSPKKIPRVLTFCQLFEKKDFRRSTAFRGVSKVSWIRATKGISFESIDYIHNSPTHYSKSKSSLFVQRGCVHRVKDSTQFSVTTDVSYAFRSNSY